MEVATQLNYNIWDRVLGQTKEAQEKGSDPLLWAIQVSSNLSSAGITLPSLELANHLVSYICWDNNVPISWKFLEKALALKIVPPLLVLGLLSTRVIPYRHSCPAAFRLYMELLKRHAFSLKEYSNLPNYQKTMNSLDQVLHLSQIFGLQANEAGALLVMFVFSIAWQLVDAALDDEGLLELTENDPRWPVKPQDMQVDVHNMYEEKRKEYRERFRTINTIMAIQLLGQFLQNKVTSRILYLARQNMYAHWKSFIQRMHLLVENSLALRNSKSITPEVLLQLISDSHEVKFQHFQASLLQEFHPVVQSRPLVNPAGLCLGTSRSALWLPLDMLLEDAMDGSQVNATSAVEIITDYTEHVLLINEFAFIIREERGIPGTCRLDTRLSMLLSITTLVVADLVEEEEKKFPRKWLCSVTGWYSGKPLSGNDCDVPGTSGNLYHLIVEACIARNLLDTSAYFWPGYVNGHINQLPHNVPNQVPGWSSFMKGASLTRFAEVEKVFEMAVKGSNEERITAATILCGASLIRGWNIQVPELAGSLMTICEVFGSCVPNISWTMTTGEEISAHAVFSNAFALLLKLWRFNHPPIEYGVGDVPPVGSQLTPEYLLLVRNSHLVSSGNLLKDPNRRRLAKAASSSSPKPIFVDSFPKLKVWYRQHLACIASPLTGLVNGTPVHHTVDTLLNMMFRKIGGGNQTVTTVTSGSSSSSGPGSEDIYLRPKLPAWDILEAVPFVADAALTACAHGRLSPRELCTGLKDLADFLPATLATIVSYFSAEVTRGVWKSVFMNGTDWPSPAANLSNVEGQIKKILAATGVDIPSLAAGGSSPASLPLPLAAFVSLTITYKLDKASQRFLDLAGPALESLAAGCPWPCMPIVASLWTQKAKRWSDFLVFSASRTVFLHSNDAVVQLLRSCFSATLGLNSSCCISSNGGIGALLGHGFGSHFNGGIAPVAPGILYLRVYRSIRDIMFLREEIVSVLMQTVEDVACGCLPKESLEKRKKSKNGMKHGHASLAATLTKVKLAASLGASVIFLTGGLGLVQSLIKETLPSWFMSIHRSEQEGERGKMLPMLRGYALAYLAALCGAFVWGVDSSTTAASKRRPKILGCHMEFLASALDGKISLGCDLATWHAYVSGFLSLMVRCTPTWIFELNVEMLRRLSKGLRRWNEEELALALLGVGGLGTMSAAAEMVIETEI
ncbi:UNVERIFIED_CONTAM: Mediator of RNA polymerase II transcription subunitA [Sesamum angustifolium]|uniref:Mediator of RNA polymerase II transcription subunitA n=1 Tax=Sesamum angustifolium TaxID=2727405 RepID=A0AAW2P0P6_9LAMI